MSDDLLPLSPEGMDYLLRNHGDVRGTAQYRCREDASKVWPLPETEHARDEAPHQESQARGDEADDGRVEVGEAAQRLEDRPEGHVPEAGRRDRPQAVGPISGEEITETAVDWWIRTQTKQSGIHGTAAEWAAEQHEKDEALRKAEARQREVLAEAKKIRIHLKDGAFVDCAVLIPWPDWMRQMMGWHGVMFDYGWIPADLIKLIAPLTTPESKGELPQNVVPFRKPT